MDDKTLQMTLLFDFFGDILTEKQREYFDLYYNEDLSLSEIAENVGITRQGVRDIILRAEHVLVDTERKTGIVKRFTEMQAEIARAEEYIQKISEYTDDPTIFSLSGKVATILQNLKG